MGTENVDIASLGTDNRMLTDFFFNCDIETADETRTNTLYEHDRWIQTRIDGQRVIPNSSRILLIDYLQKNSTMSCNKQWQRSELGKRIVALRGGALVAKGAMWEANFEEIIEKIQLSVLENYLIKKKKIQVQKLQMKTNRVVVLVCETKKFLD